MHLIWGQILTSCLLKRLYQFSLSLTMYKNACFYTPLPSQLVKKTTAKTFSSFLIPKDENCGLPVTSALPLCSGTGFWRKAAQNAPSYRWSKGQARKPWWGGALTGLFSPLSFPRAAFNLFELLEIGNDSPGEDLAPSNSMLTVQNVPEQGCWKALRIPVDVYMINMLSFSVPLAPLGAERCCLLSSVCWITDIHDQMKPRQESSLIKFCLQHVPRNVDRAKTTLAERSQELCNYPAEAEISHKNRNRIEKPKHKM